jgi:uncharacterized protein (TIGR03382 family)
LFPPKPFFSEEIEMKNVIGSLVAVAGLAAAANAQSLLNLQVSTDGINWSDNAEVRASSGATTTVLMRALVSYTGTATTIGFASLTWQPTFGNVRPGVDSVQPFANQGNNTNGGSITPDATPLDGPFGRVSPFAATGPSGVQSYAAIAHSGGSGGAPPGNYLRISRNDVTRWMGTGPTSGTGSANNFSGSGGVACVQKSFGNVGPADPPFQGGHTDVLIWQIALTVGGVGQGETHVIDVIAPTDGMSRNTTTGNREASWYASNGDNSGSVKGTVEVDAATITITPAPGALALLGLGGLVAGRRRRA